VLLSTLLHAILHPSHHLLYVLLQIANKLGLSKKKIEGQQWPKYVGANYINIKIKLEHLKKLLGKTVSSINIDSICEPTI
jgi:hypothetical protein